MQKNPQERESKLLSYRLSKLADLKKKTGSFFESYSKGQKNEARKFRASFIFVLYHSKQGKCISHFPLVRRT